MLMYRLYEIPQKGWRYRHVQSIIKQVTETEWYKTW